jgi:hypothetical protein
MKLTKQILHHLLLRCNGFCISQDGNKGRRLAEDEGLAKLGKRVRRVCRVARLHARDDSGRTALDVHRVPVVREGFGKGGFVEDVCVAVEGIDAAVRSGVLAMWYDGAVMPDVVGGPTGTYERLASCSRTL